MAYSTRAYETKAKVLDEAAGIVEAYVNTLDAVDYAGDVMPSGIFDRALKTKGKLPYLEGIDHQGIAGRTLETKQVGDQQWAKVQFNLKTQAGNDAFWHVAAGDVNEWSVKWETLDRHFETKNGERVRVLDRIDWVAFGPVIEGASRGTSTLSAKARGDLVCPYRHPKSAADAGPEDCTCDDDCGEDGCHQAEAGEKRSGRHLEHKDAPEGSFEDTTEDLLRALCAPGGFFGGRDVVPFATYPDHLIVAVYAPMSAAKDYWIVPYTAGDDGEPVPGKPIAAVLQVVPANPDEAAELDLDLEEARRFVVTESKAIAEKDDAPKSPPEGYPTDKGQYGDPKNFKYPIDKGHIAAAVSYFNHDGAREKGGYSTAEWAQVGRRIATAANKLIGPGHSFTNGSIETEGDGTKRRRLARRTTALQTKAGRRNSSGDSDHMQQSHDHMVAAHPEIDCNPDNMPGRKRRDRADGEELADRLRLLDLFPLTLEGVS